MFIGCSGSNRSAFYLYKATSAGLSATLSYVHAFISIKEVWFMCGNVLTLQYVSFSTLFHLIRSLFYESRKQKNYVNRTFIVHWQPLEFQKERCQWKKHSGKQFLVPPKVSFDFHNRSLMKEFVAFRLDSILVFPCCHNLIVCYYPHMPYFHSAIGSIPP